MQKPKLSFTGFMALFFGMLFIISVKHAQGQSHTDLEQMGLSDSVKSVREIMYSSPNSSGKDNGRLISSDKYYTFKADGNILETLVYRKGRLFSVLRYAYDSLGHKTGYQEFDAHDRLYLTVSYTCNDKGDIVEADYDRSLQKMYDDRRREIDVEYYKYYQNLYTKVLFRHNFRGDVTEATYINPQDKTDFKYEYAYNYKGFLTSKTYYNEEGKKSWREKFTNDLTGNPVQMQRFEDSRLASTSVIEYEFDKKGNWVSRVKTTEGVANVFGDKPDNVSVITIREIEYFSNQEK